MTYIFSFIAIIVLMLMSMFRVLREYERGVVFMLGRFGALKDRDSSSLFQESSKWCVLIYAPW